ncbi:AraC family transcriptional regulator [Paenibacillus sp. WQ 127069]|uniref:AraC family transcriptional regulator n=1 Tax=Paenibacillus baimaensis TaxID=2982185 RepID=A0ABT2UTQ7_9BACL|nr:AraC family transcriptional regulator [Paenibacillus sp. WQ 127069]MCU6797481.1 AraC family transcriptional regulator [Paenibacillus sp. WQ 127069]
MYLRKIDKVDLSGVLSKENGGGIHPYHEILFISDGVVALQWMGQTYLSAAPALFLLPPNTPHILVKQSEVCRFGYIELDMQGSTEFPNLVHARSWNGKQSNKDPQLSAFVPIYQTASRMWDSYDPQSPYQSIAEDLMLLDIRRLLLLITCFLKAHGLPAISPPSEAFRDIEDANQRIQKIMRYMESNYQNTMTVSLLASQAYLDVSYFIRSFHKIAGRTPLQYLHDLRLNAAACFLSTTQMPVQAISDAVGFQSIHYFSRLFKQRYDVSPSLWRKQNT